MTVDRLYRHLLQKLLTPISTLTPICNCEPPKAAMSVSENDHLRDNLFELCREMRRRRACRMPFHRRRGMSFAWPANRSPPLHYA